MNAGVKAVEITNITAEGLWLVAHGHKMYLPFSDFPWLKNQPASSVRKVVESSHGHFHWPVLDVDLTQDMIEHPERYPLASKA